MAVLRLALLPLVYDSSPGFDRIRKAVANLEDSVEVVLGRFEGAPFHEANFLQSDRFAVREVALGYSGPNTIQRFLSEIVSTSEDSDTRFTLLWDGRIDLALHKIGNSLQSTRELVCFNERKTLFLDAPETPSDDIHLSNLPRCIPLLRLHNMLLSESLLREVRQLPEGTIEDRYAPISLAEMARSRIFSWLSHAAVPAQDRLLATASALDYYRDRDPDAYENLIRYAISTQGVRELFRGRRDKDANRELVDLYFAILTPHVHDGHAEKSAINGCAITFNLCQALLDQNAKWGTRVIQRILQGEINVLNKRQHDFSGAERLLDEPAQLEVTTSGKEEKATWLQRLLGQNGQTEDSAPTTVLAVRQTNFPGRSSSPKFDFSFSSQGGFGSHVDGWNYVMQSFLEMSGHNPNGLGFDSFLEKTYVWGIGNRLERRKKPWVGITHRPFDIPQFYDAKSKLHFFQTIEFLLDRDSLQGLITVGSEHAAQLRKLLNVPVEPVLHPTNLDVERWDPACLRGGTSPKLIQIGSWLRNMHSIFRVPACSLPRALLGGSKEALLANPRFQAEARDQNNGALFSEEVYDAVEFLPRLEDSEYNALLRGNVVFLDLYDATANNAVLECIARHTPIVVRRMPATVEYLGAQYPLFFDTLEEAGQKASDKALLLEAHEYLKERSRLPDFAVGTFVENMHAAVERISRS